MKTFFFFLGGQKNFCKDVFFFFFLESTCGCVLGPWLWPRAFLSLALRVSVLGKAVLGLGLGFFCVLGFGLEPCVLDSTSVRYALKIEVRYAGIVRFKMRGTKYANSKRTVPYCHSCLKGWPTRIVNCSRHA